MTLHTQKSFRFQNFSPDFQNQQLLKITGYDEHSVLHSSWGVLFFTQIQMHGLQIYLHDIYTAILKSEYSQS